MKTLCGIAVVGLVLWSTAAPVAEEESKLNGSVLLRGCSLFLSIIDASTDRKNTPEEALNAGACYGIASGILMTSVLYEIEKNPRLACLPRTTDQVQFIRVIVTYLKSHPAELHLDGPLLAVTALRDAFPCTPAASQPQRLPPSPPHAPVTPPAR